MSNKKKKIYMLSLLAFILLGSGLFLLFSKDTGELEVKGIAGKDCVPYNIFVMPGENDYSVEISWKTRSECLGFVLYGQDRGNLDMVGVDLVNESSSRDHNVTIEGLLRRERYYFLVNSQDQAYGNNGSPLEFVIENL
ncbi:MAG TPA: hypothetical protein P5311_00135 [Candidatus Dojkabacteria bacterium]|nr:hypothetical protein [Candidatus Dojkabacteria bacterium]